MTFLRLARLASTVLLAGPILLAQDRIRPVSPADVNQQVEFSVYLPLQNAGQLDQFLAGVHDPNSRDYHRWLTPQEFHQRFGPRASDMAGIQAALASRGLKVIGTQGRGMRVRGSVAAIQGAFGAPIWNGRAPNGARRLVATRPLKLPASLAQAGAHVLAFAPLVGHHTHAIRVGLAPDNRYSAAGPYWFDDLKQAYDFPSYQRLTGAGRTIGIVMANDFLDSDLALYFGHEHLIPPKVIRVPVDGGAPFDPNYSFEVSLDIQQAGGMAPGATIIDYNIPDLSDQSVYDAYYTIVESNTADIVSSSFGIAEGFYTAAYNGGVDYTWIFQMYEDLFKQGNAQGITFVASSGDMGGLGLPSLSYFDPPQNPPVVTAQFLPGIEHPASSPHVTAVGGTNLITTSNPPSLDSRYVSENAYGDRLEPYDPYGVGNLVSGGVWQGGGGVSVVFNKPPYQYLVRTGANMRTVPDISGHMGGCPVGTIGDCPDDRSSVVVADGGNFYLVIGTSASAPDFAGILALAEQNLHGKRLGNVNYLIYAYGAAQSFGPFQVFHQGIPGDNGLYVSHQGVRGYNLVLGNGTPFVRRFILAPFVPPAGIPQTPSNP
jgi:subtilase family serine protease